MNDSWVPARVLEASDRSYAEVLLPLLDKARKEIVLSLYLIEPNDEAPPAHPVNRLMESLLRARKRGVQVRIYLNTNFRFRPKNEVGRGGYFERLLSAGVELTALLPNRRLHDKLIVIDRRYVVEGSMNWSAAALESNYESVSFIDSPAHARKKLERIARLTLPPLPRERQIDHPLLPVPPTVKIPAALFERDRLPRMVRESDGRTMDFYLILLGQARAAGKNQLDMDLETLGQAAGIGQDWERSRIRRQVIKVLRKLAARYNLIEVDFTFARNARINFLPPAGEEILVPGRLLEADFLAKETSGAVFLALARELLKTEGVDIDSLSAPQLEKRFGVGQSTFVRARSSSSTAPSRTNP